MLPKGSEDGKPFQFFFFIYPYNGEEMHQNYQDAFSKVTFDGHPMMYPLNRFIRFEKMWEILPNALFHEEKIYFRDVYDLKLSQHTRA